jgi:hypothetical protein
MPDETEFRCARCDQERKGNHRCFNTQELEENFEVLGFSAPFVVVRQKHNGVRGSLQFTHMPRWYFDWLEDE